METVKQDMFKEIVQELECPVCLEYMVPPIIVICMNGHNVCSKCAPNLQDACPTCRLPVLNIRNIAMENVARNVKYPCVNQKWGCDKALTLDGIENHQAECFHNRRQCPWAPPCGRCPWTGSTAALKAHLTDLHNDITAAVEDGQKLELVISTYGRKTLSPNKIISVMDETFIHCSSFIDNRFYCIVQYVGTKEDAERYKYKFSVSRDRGKEKISVTLTVSSDTVGLRKIREEGNCVQLPCDLLKKYCVEGNTDDGYSLFPVLKYSIKISEIEAESDSEIEAEIVA